MNPTLQRAQEAYDAWHPVATKAFDLLLTHPAQSYTINLTYDCGMIEKLDGQNGWVDGTLYPMDMSAHSGHALFAFKEIEAAFDEGVRQWTDPLRMLSFHHQQRFYLYANFSKLGIHQDTWFHMHLDMDQNVQAEGASFSSFLEQVEKASHHLDTRV